MQGLDGVFAMVLLLQLLKFHMASFHFSLWFFFVSPLLFLSLSVSATYVFIQFFSHCFVCCLDANFGTNNLHWDLKIYGTDDWLTLSLFSSFYFKKLVFIYESNLNLEWIFPNVAISLSFRIAHIYIERGVLFPWNLSILFYFSLTNKKITLLFQKRGEDKQTVGHMVFIIKCRNLWLANK